MGPIETTIARKVIRGISARTNNQQEMDPASAKIPSLWQTFFEENLTSRIPNQLSDSPVFGVYSAYESDVDGDYTLTVGVEISESNDLLPEFTEVEVPAGKYLLFKAEGPLPQIVFETWKQVWDYFGSKAWQQRAFTTDFEVYPAPNEVLIHVAVK